MRLKIKNHSIEERKNRVLAGLLGQIKDLGFEVIDESDLDEYGQRSSEVYDPKGRLYQLAEECSELAVAASHAARGRDGWQDELATEIADVEMMLDAARRLVPTEKLEAARERQLERAWAALAAEIIELGVDDLVEIGDSGS